MMSDARLLFCFAYALNDIDTYWYVQKHWPKLGYAPEEMSYDDAIQRAWTRALLRARTHRVIEEK